MTLKWWRSDTFRCSSGPYSVDMSRAADNPFVQTNTVQVPWCSSASMVHNSTCSCFSSLSDDAGGKVILDVEEADPEVIRKCACGQWNMGGRAGILITCGAYVVSDKRGVGKTINNPYGIPYAKISRNSAKFYSKNTAEFREIPCVS
jgi:hypothetical protein